MKVEREKRRAESQAIVQSLLSNDSDLEKTAGATISKMLRKNAREDGIFRHVLTPETVTDDLHRDKDNPFKLSVIRDLEIEGTGAVAVPFQTGPVNVELNIQRYEVVLERIMSRRLTLDRAFLKAVDYDVLQKVRDLHLKDILSEEDRKSLAVIDTTCNSGDNTYDYLPTAATESTPANRQTVATAFDAQPRTAQTGTYGFVEVGLANRAGLASAFKGITSAKNRLNATRALVNTNFVNDIVAEADPFDASDNIAEQTWEKGFYVKQIMGREFMVSIKHEMIEEGVMYMFAPEEFLGDFLILEDVTTSTETRNHHIELYTYEAVGMTYQNVGAMAKAKFTNSDANTWDEGQTFA